MWEHARRWRVGNPAGSAGGRLGVRGWPVRTPTFIPPPICAPAPDFIWLKGLRAMSEAAAMWWFKELKVVKVVAKL